MCRVCGCYKGDWHSYTDDHRGQLIADVISNSDHITLNTNTPTRVPNITLQQTSSPDITTVSNTLYNRTSWTTQHALLSDHLAIITTINIRHDDRLQQNRRTFTNYKKADWTQYTEDTESAFAQINIHTANIIFTNIILMADKQSPNNTAYTRWSCHSGLANPVQIVSTPPAPSNGGPITSLTSNYLQITNCNKSFRWGSLHHSAIQRKLHRQQTG